MDGITEKFEEKTEGPRYRKWIKKIKKQVDKNKLDLDLLHKEVIKSFGVSRELQQNLDIEVDNISEPDILDTLQSWI